MGLRVGETPQGYCCECVTYRSPSGVGATLGNVWRAELGRLLTWGERHRRLVARFTFVLFLCLVVVVASAALLLYFEENKPGSEIHTYWDASFFATVQTLTVSSQMPNPVTTPGRIIDIFLELWALVVVTGIAGSFASFFLSVDSKDLDVS
jgi:hypothetical protein